MKSVFTKLGQWSAIQIYYFCRAFVHRGQANRFYSLDFWQFPIAKVPEFINAVSDAKGVAEFTFTDDLGGFIGTSEIALRGFQNAKPLAGF